MSTKKTIIDTVGRISRYDSYRRNVPASSTNELLNGQDTMGALILDDRLKISQAERFY